MSKLKLKIDHPGVAFCIIIVIAALLGEYGVTKGAMLLFALFAGIILYKFITAQ